MFYTEKDTNRCQSKNYFFKGEKTVLCAEFAGRKLCQNILVKISAKKYANSSNTNSAKTHIHTHTHKHTQNTYTHAQTYTKHTHVCIDREDFKCTDF